MKRILKDLAFSLIFLLFVLTLVEVAARVLGKEEPPGWDFYAIRGLDEMTIGGQGETVYRKDEDLLWTLKPNYTGYRSYVSNIFPITVENRSYKIAINSYGFRGDEIDLQKAKNQFVILCAGDSVTFGVNADQELTYPAQLQKKLDQLHPGRFLVLNAGVPGYTSLQGRMLLEKMPFPVRPNLILVGYGHNDGFLNLPNFERMRALLAEQGVLRFVKKWLNRSRAYRMYKNFLLSYKNQPPPGGGSPTYENYIRIIDWARAHQMEVWLLAMNNLPIYGEVQKAAQDKKVQWVDFNALFSQNGGEALMSEGIHPNEKGYEFMAGVLAEKIQKEYGASAR